jgi:DNA-binding CsgD family transcriptional regulator
MRTLPKIILIFLLLLVLLQMQAYTQPSFPINKWVKQLDSDKIHEFKTVNHIINTVWLYDSITVANIFSEMEEKGKSLGPHFHFRMQHLRIWHPFFLRRPLESPNTKPMLDKLLKEAYATGNKKLVAYASWVYANLLDPNKNIEIVLTHKLKAVELFEGEEAAGNLSMALIDVGEWLFQTREFRQSVDHINEGLKTFKETPDYVNQYHYKRIYNTLGQGYQQLSMGDSAMYYFSKSIEASKASEDPVWQGINALYIGQIDFNKGDYEAAKSDLYSAYNTNKRGETSIAANALQWLSKILIREKKLDSAALYLKEAEDLLGYSPPWTNVLQIKNFLQQIYGTKAELYRVLNMPDKADSFNTLQSKLKDSLQAVAISSNSKMSQLRIDNERTQYAFLSLQSEKEKEEQKRNFIIAIISLVAIVAIIILNRQKRLLKYKQELSVVQKAALIAEGEAAREQLELFTRNLLEKTELLENLQKQVREKSVSKEQQEWLTELTSQTILTEDDWIKFKALFERMYPGFFIKLKDSFPEITGAEQRMAALSRLQLMPTQIAAILGISVNSVHKTRQRLRQRLNLSKETTMEAFLAQM